MVRTLDILGLLFFHQIADFRKIQSSRIFVYSFVEKPLNPLTPHILI